MYSGTQAHSTSSQDNTAIQRLPNSEAMNTEKNLVIFGIGLLCDQVYADAMDKPFVWLSIL